ncbi:protein FAM53B [Monodelphis domestica]|uniref:protein FAM53B n=1 Tax=Monodelphis domestica TaxID=13616 RepID=UPI0024E1FECE|nr:protein FAM53B [Monodelphis domestica]
MTHPNGPEGRRILGCPREEGRKGGERAEGPPGRQHNGNIACSRGVTFLNPSPQSGLPGNRRASPRSCRDLAGPQVRKRALAPGRGPPDHASPQRNRLWAPRLQAERGARAEAEELSFLGDQRGAAGGRALAGAGRGRQQRQQLRRPRQDRHRDQDQDQQRRHQRHQRRRRRLSLGLAGPGLALPCPLGCRPRRAHVSRQPPRGPPADGELALRWPGLGSLPRWAPAPDRCHGDDPDPASPEQRCCGLPTPGAENGRWRDLDRKCPLQLDQPSPSIWDCLPEKGPDGGLWSREAAATCSVTSLIQDLSLSDPHGHPSAPPSKRQCRSLSFSDELSGCRTAWRPLGSKVWTPVEKRRCYSGGSVQRYSGASCPMQRSSSFSLPSRTSASASASALSSPAPSLGRWGGQPCLGAPGAAASASIQRSLSCSHERFSRSEDGPPSASSTPASTPEPARRAGGLSRSRSQPCVLNDKKAGVKRRRPDDPQEPRPSLDLAKMTQNCQTFNSLSCLSAAVDDCCGQSPLAPSTHHAKSWTALLSASASTEGREPTGTPGPDPPPATGQRTLSKEDLSLEEADSGLPEEERASAWPSTGTDRVGLFPLDGELDIEQIENN